MRHPRFRRTYFLMRRQAVSAPDGSIALAPDSMCSIRPSFPITNVVRLATPLFSFNTP